MTTRLLAFVLFLLPAAAFADIANDDSAGDDDDGGNSGCSASGVEVGAGLASLAVAALAGVALRRRR